MTFYSFLSLACRLVGFVQLADSFWHSHQLKVKAREIANTPTTRGELEKTLEDGKL
ncbi:hypothetical protein [Zavarzinella formosa]|uniref:hypothetical protein n=1 Tax=Zavarzinella formosa TaxID=360055 RepID=UPI00031DB61A|nr:hypothetical protein [Zavarzinella formosa]